jgi:hypothetical protein
LPHAVKAQAIVRLAVEELAQASVPSLAQSWAEALSVVPRLVARSEQLRVA